MAGKQLRAEVVIGGRTDASYQGMVKDLNKLGKLGNQMAKVGTAMTLGITVPLVNAGKEAVNLYKDFDDAARYVKALGNLTDKQFEAIQVAARKAGATTRYTAEGAMQAMAYAAQSGKSWQENIDLLPHTLNLATAGNIELVDASSLLLTAMAATGTEIEDTGRLVDELAVAAASSKSSVDGLMEGMQRLGATGRYLRGGITEEITLLGLLGNIGYEGSEGGTQLRNTLLSLVAPTDRASELMHSLGVSSEELEETLEGLDKADAKKALQELGVKALDAQGEVRPLMDTLGDLNAKLAGKGEGEKLDFLSRIFPKRTLSGATGLMEQLGAEYDALYNKLENSAGAAEKMATTREEGIGGVFRELQSGTEELQLSLAKALEPEVIGVANFLRESALWISEIDPSTMTGIVKFLEGVAATGPILLAGAGGLKLITTILSMASSPTGWASLGVAGLLLVGSAIRGVAAAVQESNAAYELWKLRDAFGDIELSDEQIDNILHSADTAFDGYSGRIQGTIDKLGELEKQYTETDKLLAAEMLEVQFKNEVTDEDAASMKQYAQQLITTLQTSIHEAANNKQLLIDAYRESGSDESSVTRLEALYTDFFSTMRGQAAAAGADFMAAYAEGVKSGFTEDVRAKMIAAQEKLREVMDYTANVARIKRENTVDAKMRMLTFDNMDALTKEIKEANAEALTAYDEATIDEMSSAEAAALALGQSPEDARKARDDARKVREAPRKEMVARQELLEAQIPLATLINGVEAAQVEYERRIAELPTEQEMYDRILKREGMSDELMTDQGREMTMGRAMEERSLLVEDANKKLQDTLGNLKTMIPDLDAEHIYGLYEQLGMEVPEYVRNGLEMAGGLESLSSSIDGIASGLPGALAEDGAAGADALMSSIKAKLANFRIEVPVSWRLPRALPTPVSSVRNGAQIGAFAEGGRTDEMAIFGEVPGLAEWAIPEEHTPRTLDLLHSAATASGFTPEEILTGDAGSSSVDIHYAPTIQISGNADENMIRRVMRETMDEMMNLIEERLGIEARMSFAMG